MDSKGQFKQQVGIAINQSPYSFGLERVYSLEKVDPKTIRPFQVLAPLVEAKKKEERIEPYLECGGGFPPLTLLDRIDRLSLPQTLLYQIKKEGWESIEELLSAYEQSHPKLKTLPSALQEILRKSLSNWLEIRRIGKVTKLDLKAYLRGMGNKVEPLAFLTLLQQVNLLSYFGTSAYEKVQVERLSPQEKRGKIEQAVAELQKKEIFVSVLKDLLFGWLDRRGGITNRKELIERMEQVSFDVGGARGVFELFEKFIYKNCEKPWVEIEEGILLFELSVNTNLSKIKEALPSLFYRPKITYDFEQICTILQREFLLDGVLLDKSLLSRYFLLSSAFRMKKLDEKTLSVTS